MKVRVTTQGPDGTVTVDADPTEYETLDEAFRRNQLAVDMANHAFRNFFGGGLPLQPGLLLAVVPIDEVLEADEVN